MQVVSVDPVIQVVFYRAVSEALMLRVPISQVQAGMQIALPVVHPERPAQVLLKANFILSQNAINRLQDINLNDIWIKYEGLEFVERYINPALFHARADLALVGDEILDRFQWETDRPYNWARYKNLMEDMIEELQCCPLSAIYVEDPAPSKSYHVRHAVDTCYISVLLGLKLQSYLSRQRRHSRFGPISDLVSLGLGALLHDVGMKKVPEASYDHWAATFDENDPEYQNHVQVGYGMVTGQLEPAAAAAVLQHHQYYDGSGFPAKEDWNGKNKGLIGEQIHVFARIVTVADQFASLHCQPAGAVWPTVRALRYLISGAILRRLDPIVVSALLGTVPAYLPGSHVTLSDGRQGYVVDWKPGNPCQPTIALINDPTIIPETTNTPEQPIAFVSDTPPISTSVPIVDLARTADICIVEADGVDVSADQFEIPPALRPITKNGAPFGQLDAA